MLFSTLTHVYVDPATTTSYFYLFSPLVTTISQSSIIWSFFLLFYYWASQLMVNHRIHLYFTSFIPKIKKSIYKPRIEQTSLKIWDKLYYYLHIFSLWLLSISLVCMHRHNNGIYKFHYILLRGKKKFLYIYWLIFHMLLHN